LQAVQEVNTHVNESKRKEENTQKLHLIQKGTPKSRQKRSIEPSLDSPAPFHRAHRKQRPVHL
jgi:hypothetical protein